MIERVHIKQRNIRRVDFHVAVVGDNEIGGFDIHVKQACRMHRFDAVSQGDHHFKNIVEFEIRIQIRLLTDFSEIVVKASSGHSA